MVLAEAGEQGMGALASGGAGGAGEAWDGKQPAAPALTLSRARGRDGGSAASISMSWANHRWCGRKAALGNSREDAEIRAMKSSKPDTRSPDPAALIGGGSDTYL